MMRATGCFENHKSANPPMLFHRLADIIDPTCHNKQIEINKMAPLEFRTDNIICSNCGETFCADPDGINAPIDWAYCPNCGYKIVETNEDDDVEYIFCGGCGEEFSTDLFNEYEITHCPYCGCRLRNLRQN